MKANYAGTGSQGEPVFKEVGSDRHVHLAPITPDQPMRLGEALGTVEPSAEPGVFDIATVDGRPIPMCDGQPSHGGPAQVSTPAYRDGWDRIFAKPSSQAN